MFLYGAIYGAEYARFVWCRFFFEVFMSRTIGMLSILKITSLIKAEQKGMHSDGGGLYLRIDPRHGSASWIFRYRDKVSLKLRDKGMGRYSDISLKDARQLAAQLRTMCAQGFDPIDSKRKELAEIRASRAKIMTFGDCAESFFEKEQHGWSEKTRQTWRRTIDMYCKPILQIPINEIQTEFLAEVLKPLWFKRTYTGKRVRGRIESIFEHAKERKLFSGENPAAWRGALRGYLPKSSDLVKEDHHPALPYQQAPEFFDELARLGAFDDAGTLSVKSLALVALTACRVSNVVEAKWSEFDFTEQLWTIPKDQMKTGEEHVVPLCPAAIKILMSLHTHETGFVFPSDKLQNDKTVPITIAAPYKVFKKLFSAYTVHGLRTTFRNWAGAITDYPEHLAEAALAHKPKDRVQAAYMRDKLIEKRRVLMDDWAKYCTSLVK